MERSDDDTFEDETIVERIIGLREMFPAPVRNLVGKIPGAAKTIFSSSRFIVWTICSTATIAVLPLSFEIERAEYERQQKNQERSMMFGPES